MGGTQGVGTNRCPDCTYWVSTDLAEPELSSVTLVDEGPTVRVACEVRLLLACHNCTLKFKEGLLKVDVLVNMPHARDCLPERKILLFFEPQKFEEFDEKARIRTRTLGARCIGELECDCGTAATFDWEGRIQSSAMSRFIPLKPAKPKPSFRKDPSKLKVSKEMADAMSASHAGKAWSSKRWEAEEARKREGKKRVDAGKKRHR